jgi:signal peptidase II
VTASLLRLGAIAAVVVAFDQWTKHWATATLMGRPNVPVIGEFVQLTYTRNSGVAFGLGAGLPFPYYLFSILAIIAILVMVTRRKITHGPRHLALALIMGGAIGNLIDRLASGEVVDFILLSWRHWQFPVFNVADSAVTAGVVLFAFAWPYDAHEEKSATPATPAVPHPATPSDPNHPAEAPVPAAVGAPPESRVPEHESRTESHGPGGR